MSLRVHNRRGFTLLELMLASAMIAILAGSLYGTLHIASKASASATSAVENVRKTSQIMEIIQADLQSALITKASQGTLATNFTGVSGGSMVGGTCDSLEFYSTIAEGELGPSVGDVKKIEYYCQSGDNDQLSLIRGVTANLLPPIEIDPKEEVICRNVRSFTLRYFDGSAWQENWDSTTLSNALPMAIEVSIEFAADSSGNSGQTYPCSRIILIPTGQATSSGT